MITDDREIVSAIRACLAERLGKDRCEVWFGPTTILAVRGETLVISAPSPFFQDWLRSHYRKDLEVVTAAVFGKPLDLEFRIAEVAGVSAPSTLPMAQPTVAIALADATISGSLPSAASPVTKTASESKPVVKSAESASPARPELMRRRMSELKSFVVGPSNRLAHQAAQMAIEQPGGFSPLLVHGPTGCGKTHLLEGIYAAFRQTHPRLSAVYLSAEQFTSHFLQALHGSGMASFRAKYRDLSLLVIDDLQFLTNKKATLGELQHTIDTLLRGGKQLVFAADRSPSALKALGPELASRFSGGMVCRMEPAEYATRLGIVKHQAILLGLNVPDDVQAYIAAHLTTQARELIGALKRLQATSLAHNRPITLALAEEALAELCDQQGRVVKLNDIEKAVCDVFGLMPDSLQSARKGKSVSHPRMLAMYLARKYTRAPLNEIGSYFGRRSHSTVISAQKKVETWMANGAGQKVADGALSFEETLRRVEEHLRAG